MCKEFFEWAATEDGQKEKIPKPDKMTPGTSFYGSPIKGGSCVKRWNEPRLGLEDRGLKLDFYYVRQKLGVGPSQFF